MCLQCAYTRATGADGAASAHCMSKRGGTAPTDVSVLDRLEVGQPLMTTEGNPADSAQVFGSKEAAAARIHGGWMSQGRPLK